MEGMERVSLLGRGMALAGGSDDAFLDGQRIQGEFKRGGIQQVFDRNNIKLLDLGIAFLSREFWRQVWLWMLIHRSGRDSNRRWLIMAPHTKSVSLYPQDLG